MIKILIEQNTDKKTKDFKNIIDQLLTLIIIFQDDCVKYINKAEADILEYPINDIQHWSINDFLGIIYKEDLKIFLKHFRKGQEGKSSRSNKYVCRILTGTGKIKWVEFTSNSIQYQSKTAVLVIINNYTDTKETELRLSQLEEKSRKLKEDLVKKLSKSEMNYKNLIEHLGMHLMIIDRDEIFQVVNEKAAESMSGKPIDFIGKSLTDIFPKDVAGKYIKLHQGIFKSGKGITFEHNINLPTGTRTFYTSEQPVKDMQGNIISIQIISLDVTEPKIIKQKLKESEGNLKKINDAFFKFTDDPLFNFQILINTAGILLKADCAMFNRLKKVKGKDILETVAIYKEPPGFIKESEAEGHICTDIIKDNIDGVVILTNLDESKYAKTDGNVLKYNLKQYISFVVRFNKIPIATFCVIYMDNREMSENDINILKILSQSASIEFARLNSRNKLIESEEKYRTLFESSKDGIIFTSMEGKILNCNQAYLDMLGYTLEEIKEFTYQQLTPEKWHEMESTIVTNQFTTRGYSDEYEKEYIKKDGTIFPISIKGWLIEDEKGKPIGMWGFIRNVSERKKVEYKLKESEENYKSERDNLINILNSMEDGVYITNKNYDIEYINPALIKEFGPIKGKKCYEYTQSCSEPCPWCTTPEILKGNTIRSEWYSFKNHKTYDKIDTPLRKSDGKISMLKIFRDITDRKKAEELIKKENEKLKELDNIKNNFIIRASYEFKNPLTSINNASEILLDYYKDKLDERALRLIKVIKEGGERLYSLIKDIVDITKIKSKKLKLKLEKINITKLLHECISDLSFLALQRDTFLNIVVNNNVYLFVDKDRIKQVIREMILNGINNSPPGNIVSIILQEFNDCVKIIIKDNGVGFTEDEKKKVFKKFGKIERHGKNLNIITTGMGLGLYLSKKIILFHGGTIMLESKGRNEGTAFIINLPKIFNQ